MIELWTDAAIARAIELHLYGLSARIIADRLVEEGLRAKASKGSIIGMLSRKGVTRPVAMSQANRRDGLAKVRPQYTPKPAPTTIDETPAPEWPSSAAEAVMNLTSETCHWPVGDVREPGFRFCSAESGGHVYCQEHQKAAYVPYHGRKLNA